MLALATVDGADSDWVIIGALALSGLGMGSSSPALASSIANAVEDRDLGIAGAAQQMANQVGVAIGIQVMLAVQTGREAAVGAVPAYGDAYLTGAAVALLGVALALFVRSTPRTAPAPAVVREPAPRELATR
jgi:MFS family permease